MLAYADKAADDDEAGNPTEDAVCVALAVPLVLRVGVTFSVPSAMLTRLMVRLKSARAACAVKEVSGQTVAFRGLLVL